MTTVIINVTAKKKLIYIGSMGVMGQGRKGEGRKGVLLKVCVLGFPLLS